MKVVLRVAAESEPISDREAVISKKHFLALLRILAVPTTYLKKSDMQAKEELPTALAPIVRVIANGGK